jgi:hypothetical protein
VDSFIAGGLAAHLDSDLAEDGKGYKNPNGGLTQKGRDHYNRETGGHLKAPVTTKPSKLKPGSKSANRRKSFCARMGGMKKRLTSAKTAHDPDSRINKALRKWNCHGEEVQTEDCWKGYKAIGVKKKNGKTVPNCVPEDVVQRHADHKVVRVKKAGNFIYRKVYEAEASSSNTNDPSNRFVGTDSIRRNYTDATPGQQEAISIAKYSVAKPVVGDAADGPDKDTKTPAHFKDVRKALAGIRESRDLNESFAAGFTLAPFARDYGIKTEGSFVLHPDVEEEIEMRKGK